MSDEPEKMTGAEWCDICNLEVIPKDVALAMVAADRAENCVNCCGSRTDMHGDPCNHGLPADAKDALDRLIAEAVRKEREACAAIAEEHLPRDMYEARDSTPEYNSACCDIAAAIKNRSNPNE